jgi:sarcosine oxidase
MDRVDIVVAGLGVMGASVAHECALRGHRVIGIDRLAPPHAMGSSHGRTRIIREAYFEHPLYVPLVRRAFERWSELESRSGNSLFQQTGALMAGPADGTVIRGTLASVSEHSIPHEVLDAGMLRERFPALHLPESMAGVLETRAGVLHAESCHEALLHAAMEAGATLRTDERVLNVRETRDSVRVTTSSGEIDAGRVVMCCGAWLPELLARSDADLPLSVERQVVGFFDPAAGDARFSAERCPILLVEDADGAMFYSLPDTGYGLKAGIHHTGDRVTPVEVDRVVSETDIERIRTPLARHMPAANGVLRSSVVCLYTNTPDEHFVIDALPASARSFVVSACSGHGFKFAPVIGEIVCRLIGGEPPVFDLAPFRAGRFARNEAARTP